jgi:hypothetical protein
MSRYRQTMREALEQVYKKEDKDHEVSMARGELEAIADKATQLAGALQGKSDEGNPLEAWVQSKITKAKDYINSVSDYLMYNPEMANEGYKTVGNVKGTEFKVYKNGKLIKTFPTYIQAHDYVKQNEELEEAKIISDISGVGINVIKKEVMPFNVKVGRVGPGMDSDYEVEFIGSEPNLIKYAKKHLDFDGNSFSQLKKHLAMEETEVNEKTYGWTLVSKAKDLAKKFANNITKAVDEIEKLEKGLSKNPTVDAELRKYNESLEEKYTVVITKKDGSTMELGRYNTPAEAQRYVDMYGKGAKVKKEEVELDEKNTDKYVWSDINTAMMRAGFSPGMIMKVLSALKGKELSEELDEIDEKISDIFKANKEGESIDDIAKRLKLSTSMVKKLIGEAKDEEEKKEEPKKEENKESEIQSLKDQIAMLKQKLENEKNKAIKPEPNPETGEVPLTIGIAHAEFKKEKEKKEVKEENLQELSKAERDKRIQRAKDMIKYYDAQKKAALKGPNKALAKKMLKNETELEEGTKPTDFKVKMKTPSGMKMVKVTVPVKDYKVDMAAIEDAARKKIKGDMMDFDFVGDLKMGESLEEVSQKEIDKFHTDLDNLVHKTFGHSSDEKKKEKMDEKVASSIIKDLQKAYAPMKGKTISPEMANKISKHLDQPSYDLNVLRQLKKADIPFISTIARNKIYKKTGKFEELEESKDMDKHFKTLSNKVQSKVNELLRTGMGYWDAVAKAKRMYNEDKRLYVEGIAGLQKKADKSGMPYNILKQVYDRGMAAWKSGHRPGASQQQWAFARVNSFITKSSGTWGGADKDLAAKVKGSK